MGRNAISRRNIGHYDRHVAEYHRHGLEHDLSQNHAAFLDALPAGRGCTVLDLGCGTGRDLKVFRDQGHQAVGLDGSPASAALARQVSGCPVWVQDFLDLDLPDGGFDGIFANAALFHVPMAELPRVLGDLRRALKPGGVMLVSNPRGRDEEGWCDDRYLSFLSFRTWCRLMRQAGFARLAHYYRPPGLPRAEQLWLVSLWRRGD